MGLCPNWVGVSALYGDCKQREPAEWGLNQQLLLCPLMAVWGEDTSWVLRMCGVYPVKGQNKVWVQMRDIPGYVSRVRHRSPKYTLRNVDFWDWLYPQAITNYASKKWFDLRHRWWSSHLQTVAEIHTLSLVVYFLLTSGLLCIGYGFYPWGRDHDELHGYHWLCT